MRYEGDFYVCLFCFQNKVYLITLERITMILFYSQLLNENVQFRPILLTYFIKVPYEHHAIISFPDEFTQLSTFMSTYGFMVWFNVFFIF